MKTPYTLYADDENIQPDRRLENLPKWCTYPLPFAKEKKHFQLPELELYSQQLNYRPFFIDLVEIKVNEPTYIPFVIHDRQLYMYFMLQGSLIYMTEDRRPIIKTQPNTFLMSYYDTGSYFAYADPGNHIALVLNIHPEWIELIYQNYDNLKQVMQRFKSGSRPFEILYQCRMDRKINRWIYKIYSYSQNNIGALDGNLRKYVSFLLEYYNDILAEQNSDPTYRIRAYLEEHYCDKGMSVKYLAEHFCVTERTLNNIFKRRYDISVLHFYTSLRLDHALFMINQKGIAIKDVYMEVGYADEHSFRAALERYLVRII